MSKPESTLIFLTYQYPYLPGEYFIEEEIKYLAESFDRIFVLPARLFFWKSSQPARETPENVALWDPSSIPSFVRLIWYFRACVKLPWYLRCQRKRWVGRVDIPTTSLLAGLKTAFKAMVVSNSIKWFAKRNALAPRAVGYAYWRDFSAAGLCLSRETLDLKYVCARAHRVDIYSPFRWPNESVIHTLADCLFPVSENGRWYLKEHKGLNTPHIEVKRLGVRLPQKVANSSTDGVLRILSCSNVIPIKRVELIARVVAELSGPVEWAHIGDGEGMEELRTKVIGLFDSSHKANFVGRLANTQVYKFYQMNPVDLFINLSESEGVPVSIMEAMAHGVPCVATDVGGTAEIVNESNGAVLPVDSEIEDICTVIEIVLNKKSARESARKQAELMCSADRNYREFCEMLVSDVG